MKCKILLLAPMVGALMFTGCATLFGGGGKQTVSVNIDGEKRVKGTLMYEGDAKYVQHFTAPATLNVERRSADIILKSDNDEFHDTVVPNSVNGWFLVNILGFPGGTVISSTTDAATGSMWKYDETVNLSAKQKASIAPSESSTAPSESSTVSSNPSENTFK